MVHVDVVGGDGVAVRLSVSSLFHTPKTTGSWLQFPAPPAWGARWTLLRLDLPAMLAASPACAGYAAMRGLQLGANMWLRFAFVADTLFAGPDLPRAFSMFVPAHSTWNEHYALVAIPPPALPPPPPVHPPPGRHPHLPAATAAFTPAPVTTAFAARLPADLLPGTVAVLRHALPRRDRPRAVRGGPPTPASTLPAVTLCTSGGDEEDPLLEPTSAPPGPDVSAASQSSPAPSTPLSRPLTEEAKARRIPPAPTVPAPVAIPLPETPVLALSRALGYTPETCPDLLWAPPLLVYACGALIVGVDTRNETQQMYTGHTAPVRMLGRPVFIAATDYLTDVGRACRFWRWHGPPPPVM